jgi:hypothetical protein
MEDQAMPTISIELTNELEQRLQHRAAERGIDVARVAAEILNDGLYDPAMAANADNLPYEIWCERFEAWIKNVPQVNTGFVDDSRESIYQGRGE